MCSKKNTVKIRASSVTRLCIFFYYSSILGVSVYIVCIIAKDAVVIQILRYKILSKNIALMCTKRPANMFRATGSTIEPLGRWSCGNKNQ